MYVHAYQSYVWNAIVSERIRMHGAERPAVGDLVFDTDAAANDDGEDAVEGPDDDLVAEENKDDGASTVSRLAGSLTECER